MPGARPARQGLEIKNKNGEEEPWKREKKEMNNKEGKEEPWKRGKKGMNNKEGRGKGRTMEEREDRNEQ